MKPGIVIILISYLFNPVFAKENYKRISGNEIQDVVVRYDPNVLRIPGNCLPIGITTVLKNDKVANTKGYLKGSTKWLNYKLDIDGGYFFMGNIYIGKNELFLQGEGITVKIYSRKSKKLLKTQFIPYNYEKDIYIITKGDFRKAPGNKIDIGLVTVYDNDAAEYFWPKSNNQLKKNFICIPNGASLYNANLQINPDPFTIDKHTVSLVAFLNKNSNIADTLNIILDYRDHFNYYSSGSSGWDGAHGCDGCSGTTGNDGCDGTDGLDGDEGQRGHDIVVFADVYFDTLIYEELMYIEVANDYTNEMKRFLLNTDGGSITVTSSGGSGGDGGRGGDGGDGGDGIDGPWKVEIIWENDSTFKQVHTQLPGTDGAHGGNGGDGGCGGDGGDGGNIYIEYTQFAQPFLHLIEANSISGRGGSGGFGGNAGRGGKGGSGNPSGTSGSSGFSGSFGFSGSSGRKGKVKYLLVYD